MVRHFSLLVPTFDPSAVQLRGTIESILAQDYPSFDVRVIDDASTTSRVRRTLDEFASDSRVAAQYRSNHVGNARALSDALDSATGDFVGVVEPGSSLDPGALGAINHHLSLGADDVDFLYTDDALTSEDGLPDDLCFKPDWSPERLRSQFYTGHFAMVRRSLANDIGGFRTEFEEAYLYDFAFLATERARRVLHVPRILHRSPHVVLIGAAEAGRRAVLDHCERIGLPASVESVERYGSYRVTRPVEGEPLVSVIIPTGGATRRVWGAGRVLVLEAVRSILEKSSYKNIEIVIVADATTPPDVVADLSELVGSKLKIVSFDEPFNFSKKCNLGAVAADGKYLLLLNDDVEIVTADWMETLLGLAQMSDVGLVGAKLLFADGTLQHAGQFMGDSRPQHIFSHYPAEISGPSGLLQVDRECSGVTAACAMIRASTWSDVGGMTELLPNNFNDVDLSLKLRHLGYRNVWTPHAQLYHFESLTRDGKVTPQEYRVLQTRWDEQLRVDPYGNPNLDPTRSDWVPLA